jgi:hypothetical protein
MYVCLQFFSFMGVLETDKSAGHAKPRRSGAVQMEQE